MTGTSTNHQEQAQDKRLQSTIEQLFVGKPLYSLPYLLTYIHSSSCFVHEFFLSFYEKLFMLRGFYEKPFMFLGIY